MRLVKRIHGETTPILPDLLGATARLVFLGERLDPKRRIGEAAIDEATPKDSTIPTN